MRAPKRIVPGPDQESVWDYPRPPRVEPSDARVRVVHAGHTLADSAQTLRLLETSHPPTWYIPRRDCDMQRLAPAPYTTFCEFKGAASYFDLSIEGQTMSRVAWTYENPTPRYAGLRGHLCFYSSRVDACWVDDERVVPQEGDFYGGWITKNIVGPFKGARGTWGW